MDTLQWLLNKITQYLADLFFALLTYGVSFGLLGLFLGITLVIIAGKSGVFRRPSGLWKVLAAINYVYIPLVLASMGAFWGTIYGAHSSANQLIENNAKPLAEYGGIYWNQAIAIVPEIPWEQHHDKTLAEILAVEMAKRLGTVPDTEVHDYFVKVNVAVVEHLLQEADIPSSLRDPLTIIRTLQNKRLPSNVFIGLPRTILARSDDFFSLKYAWVFGLFLPFLLLPVAEYLVFRLFGGPKLLRYPAIPNGPHQTPAPTPTQAMPLTVAAEPTLNVRTTLETAGAGVSTLNEVPETASSFSAEFTLTPPPEVIPELPQTQTEDKSASPVTAAYSPAPLVHSITTTSTQPPPVAMQHSQPLFVQSTPSQMGVALKQPDSGTAVTYILGGALLQLYAGIGTGWIALFIAIFGFAIFYLGLDKLKDGMDAVGQSAAKLLKIAAIIGVFSSLIDFIPLFGLVASLGYIAAFVLELVAYVKLRDSRTIGSTGKSGATFLLIAMILAVLQALLGLLPFIGGYLAAPLGLAALMLVFFGWVRVQAGMIGEVNASLSNRQG
jgi:hypothetical protein